MPRHSYTLHVVENERDSRQSARTVPGAWLAVIDRVLQPARPELERCVREGQVHRQERQVVHQRRAAAIAACMSRIESARAAVFAADTGAVPQLMTDLEREWRVLSRKDADDGLMDLWARLTPGSWHDRKRWRDSSAADKVDAAVALAADVRGVEAAEAAAHSLRSALAAWGVTLGARIRWRAIEHEGDAVTELLAQPLLAAQAALASEHANGIVGRRSEAIRRAVRGAAAASPRLPARPLLTAEIAHAAFVESMVRAAAIDGRPDPVAPLRDLWRSGYALVEADASGVTLEIPPL